MAETKRKVIIVDDDSLILNMYSLKFQKEGIETEIFTSGEEFLDKIKKGDRADLILLDIVIPGMSGMEVLSELKKQGLAKEAKIIMLTNQNDENDIKRAEELGVDRYIVKATTIPSEVVKEALKVMAK